MSIIDSMVLIISFFLSNGDKVIYEMDENYYSQRLIFKEKNESEKDMLILHKFNEDHFHEIDVIDDSSVSIKRDIEFQQSYFFDEKKFSSSLKGFQLKNFKGVYSKNEIIGDVTYCQYYIQIDELDSLKISDDIKKDIPLIGDNYLYVYSDVFGGENMKPEIKPVDVKVEWRDTFSTIIINKLNFIKDE